MGRGAGHSASSPEHSVRYLFRTPCVEPTQQEAFERRLGLLKGVPALASVRSEVRFNVEAEDVEDKELVTLRWLLSETFEQDQFAGESFLADAEQRGETVIEVGPRLSFSTAWSSNAVSILENCGVTSVRRIERSRRYAFRTADGAPLSAQAREILEGALHDRMTEFVIREPIRSFKADPALLAAASKGVQWVPVMKEGRKALEDISNRLGLAFDDWDLDFYTALFRDKLKRDPSDVECFDMAQSNSEHSRHWFFGGKMIIDGKEKPSTLFQLVKNTNPVTCKDPAAKAKLWAATNSVIAFHDNSSAIQGFRVNSFAPAVEESAPGTEAQPKPFVIKPLEVHGILTAETHNFPCGIAPFPGAETGTGGRIRDVHATGRGAHVVAGTSSYCVGNLRIPGYEQPWEDMGFAYPSNMATPLQIEIEASNGASDYGNKFGEPVITGYTRSFGMRLANGERREWIKPIMMSAGVGLLDGRHVGKGAAEKGMLVVKVGGPAYRIGMGGGAASSRVSSDAKADANLDFNAVQRGDAEMENKMNRVIRACVELGARNPIVAIHDQGAGGNGNVLKEIADPAGCELFLRRLPIGDETMTSLELWGAEYQENNALLVREEHGELFQRICHRENMPFAFVGHVTGDGKVRVHDEKDGSVPVDLGLEDVLGKMPQKSFSSETAPRELRPLELGGAGFEACLDRVLRLLQVGSKRFLTNKVDRSVTGLVAQQQCVGPLHTPLADVGVIAQSMFPGDDGKTTGVATSIGEQPIKGLVSPRAMARLAVAESLTNLVFAKVTRIEDIKCSANWMWAAKLAGEGAAMYEACEAMCEVMAEVGMSVDGGKDSLSMAAKAGGEIVKCPGQVAISAYAMCPDVTLTVTPDLKPVDGSKLFHVAISGSFTKPPRLAGSALAQVFGQLGDVVCDLDDPKMLVRAFRATQELIEERALLAGHDVSDGGLIVAALEMAFAGNVGLQLGMPHVTQAEGLFAEEVGLLLQAKPGSEQRVLQCFEAAGVPCVEIGRVSAVQAPGKQELSVQIAGQRELLETAAKRRMTYWRDVWEATSFELEKRQTNPRCVEQEQRGLAARRTPPFKVTFDANAEHKRDASVRPKLAVLREEGSNGDREMAAAFTAAGFEAWDVSASDLRQGRITLDDFQGIAFVGGFSYADVLDSAKGWAGAIRFNATVWEQFQRFYKRSDTFSLGVCNGCQLMALLGWIPANERLLDAQSHEVDWNKQPRFVHNASGRYESRFISVRVREDNKSMMLSGMEGSVLGVWIAHGEGRVHFPDDSVKAEILANGQAPLRFVDDEGQQTEQYPFNPNGSPQGITALCSQDGRHLALMPHPERVHRPWQWPFMPEDMKTSLKHSPWMKMFTNAYDFCVSKNSK